LFTGLIAERGEVMVLERDASGTTVRIAARIAGELEPGDSIAVNGVCLTAIAVGDGGFEAQAVKETLERTTLGALTVGSAVNLEAPLRADERLGGHIVQGHVDGVGRILAIHEEGFSKVLTIALAPALARYVVEKGSVAVDGVSLTVSALDDASFSVALVPETLQRTTLGRVAVGDRVNLELDILAKYVERLLAGRASTS
jgi:riboflavin synthase